MPLQSDISIPSAKFDPANSSEQSRQVNNWIINKTKDVPKWFEVGASKYRQMRLDGNTAFPAPKQIPSALEITIPSREPGRSIPSRLVYPSARKTAAERKGVKGVVCHFHGGGWVLGDEKSTDTLLVHYADTGDLAVVSVGYRHAPEDPFPAGPNDCADAAEWLIKNAEKEYGAPLRFIGGESAGAHLSLLTTFHLLKTNPSFSLSGLLLHFGCFDLSRLPSVVNFKRPLILDQDTMKNFINAFLPKFTLEQKRDPLVSPYYEDIEQFRGRLPPAIFTIGTEDPLVDDSINMGVKWSIAGGESVVKVYLGAPHGFIAFGESLKEAMQCLVDTAEFIQDCLAK